MSTITISLPESLRDFVEQQVRTRGYGNVSEYFRGLLREAQEKEQSRRLEELLLEGLESGGPDIEVNEEFWAQKRRLLDETIERRKRVNAEV